MYDVFTKLLNMSLLASVLVLVIVLLRIVLKKAPKKIICALWILVAFRLICPISISSPLSVFNMLNFGSVSGSKVEYFQYNERTEKPELLFGVPGLVNDNLSSDSMTIGRRTADVYLPTVMYIWMIGFVAMISYAFICYVKIRKDVSASIKRADKVYVCDDINSPFILGVIRPRIYLPSGLKKSVEENVLAHENAHIKRLDFLWKPFGFLLLSVYWFNPIMWVAYVLFCRDIEAACDEKVIEDLDREGKAYYSEALLACASGGKMITVCPLAFGETNVKGRVSNILNYKKPAFWIIMVSVVALVIVAIGFATNPPKNGIVDEIPSLEEVSQYSIEEFASFRQTITQTITEKDLIKNWGEPQIVNEQRIWTVPLTGAPKFISVWVDDGKISSMGVSSELFVTVVQVENNLAKGLIGIKDYTNDLSMLSFLPQTDIWGNEIKYEVGNAYYFEFNGMIKETYPLQIDSPYLAMLMGNIHEQDIPRAVMVNGEIYYDTKQKSTLIGRCGNMDGNIDSECNANEWPTKNNQGNFGTGYGFQYGPIEGTIEISMDDAWYVFATEKVLASSEMHVDNPAADTLMKFFTYFDVADYASMANVATQSCQDTYFHEGDVFGYKRASIEKYVEEVVDKQTYKYQVDVQMETTPQSALYPATETTFSVYIVYEDGHWLVDRFTTD